MGTRKQLSEEASRPVDRLTCCVRVSGVSVAEIQSAITQLPAGELARLAAWFQEYQQQVWDKQIEDDLEAGRLDKLLFEVDREYHLGLAKPPQ
jgi:hypothetical protein